MAYQTGTASTPAALLSSLAGFASANGWSTTTLSDGAIGFTSPDGAKFAVLATVDSLALRGCITLDNTKASTAQPGASTYTSVSNNIAGPYTGYFFFSGSEGGSSYLHVVIEASAGIFKPFSLGRLVKFDTTAGGEYASAVNWYGGSGYTNVPGSGYHDYLLDSIHNGNATNSYSHVRADLDGKTNNWMRVWSQWEGDNAIGSARGGINASLLGIGYQRFNNLTPLIPLYVFGDRPSNMRSPLGYAPDLRLVDLRLLSPKQIITIGSESWQVFPAIQRTDSWGSSNSTIPNSGYYGYAMRRVI